MNSQCHTLTMPEIPNLLDQDEIVKSTDMVSSVEGSSDELSMSHFQDARKSNSN